MLLCLEASAEDADESCWTKEVRYVRGYDESDPRPPTARTLALALEASQPFEHVGLELSLGTQASDRMVGEPTTFTKGWFDAWPGAADATPLLAAARAIKTDQEIERIRLANEICAAAMEHVRSGLEPGMKESEAAAIWQGFVHGEGTGWRGRVELALGFSLVWSGAGIKTFTATGDRPVSADEPTLFEIWVCADGYWADHTKLLCPGELRADYRELEARLLEVYGRAIEHCRPGRELRRARPADPRRLRGDRLSRPAVASGLPRRRGARARAAVRAPGGRRRDRRGDGARDRARVLLGGRRRPARRGQFPDHERGRGEALLVPGRGGDDDMNDLIWTGSLNDPYRLGGHVGLYDTTLRDGEQTVGVVLDPEQKLEIARLLDELGIDRIEAGFPRVSADDWQAVERIAAAGLRAEIWGFSRAVPADLEALVELGVRFSVIESPISDLKLDAIGVSRESMLERITKAMRFAAENSIHAAFFGVDSTRAEPDFYRRVYSSAVEAGAREVVVVDTLGIASPEAVAELVGSTVELVGPDVPVHFHGHNDFGVATASAVAAVRAGAAYVQGTINGMGERAGNANLAEVALALRALYGVESNLRLDRIRATSRSASASCPATRSSRGSRSPARRSTGARAAPSRASSTTRRRSSRTPRSSSAPSARSSSARRAASTRSGSRRRSSASTCPRSVTLSSWLPSRRSGWTSEGSSTTPSSPRSWREAPVEQRARLRRRRRRDRQPVRRPSRAGRRGLGAHAPRGARARTQRRGPARLRSSRPHSAGSRPRRM